MLMALMSANWERTRHERGFPGGGTTLWARRNPWVRVFAMGLFGRATDEIVVVKTYGRGSLLGALSPILAFFMASRGMRGWQESTIRNMEDDAVAMALRGYRVVTTQEYGSRSFGITYFKVTYRLDAPKSGAG